MRVGLHPRGLAPLMVNLGDWHAHWLARLERQLAASGDPELAEPCAALEKWNVRDDLDSQAALLFRRFAQRLNVAQSSTSTAGPPPFEVPYDNEDPANTPRGLRSDDPRVRKALSLAVDRAAITEKVLKTGEIPAFGVVPPETGSYGEPYAPDWASKDFKERQAMAKALLAEAGHGPDNPLRLELSYNTSENHKRIAVAAQAMLKQAGVQAELVNREVKVHYDLLEQNQFDVARAAWVADYNDPENFLSLLETRTGVKNYGRFSDPDFDRLMQESGAERDPAKRNALMHEAEKIAVEKDAWIPIYYYVSKVLLSDKVEGFVENTKQIHRTRWLSLKQ
jgi:ABC-type oligopeptide transport system substrate-binding subunit